MVRTFCDRCGQVIAGASKLGGATVRAADEHGNEIIKLDFCAFCADWAVNKLLRKALTERHEDEQAGERAMDKLEFDLTAGKLREKETSGEKEAPESERIGWTAKKARGTAAEEKKPAPNIKGRGEAETNAKRKEELLCAALHTIKTEKSIKEGYHKSLKWCMAHPWRNLWRCVKEHFRF